MEEPEKEFTDEQERLSSQIKGLKNFIKHIKSRYKKGEEIDEEDKGKISRAKQAIAEKKAELDRIAGMGVLLRDPGKLPPSARKQLEKVGDEKITKIVAVRTPLTSTTKTFLNIISLGQFEKISKKYFDELFHLAFWINDKYNLEKNEVISFGTKNPIKSNSQTRTISVGKDITFNQLIENTRKYMGDKNFTAYDAQSNNCQNFLNSILSANGIGSADDKAWIKQDTEQVFKEVPTFAKVLGNLATTAGAAVNRLIEGEGRPRRLFMTDDGRYFYMSKGKRKYVKVPAGISQKQVVRINIGELVKPKKKRKKRKFVKKTVQPVQYDLSGRPVIGKVLPGSASGTFGPPPVLIREQAKKEDTANVLNAVRDIVKYIPREPTKIPEPEPKPVEVKELIRRKIRQYAELAIASRDYNKFPKTLASLLFEVGTVLDLNETQNILDDGELVKFYTGERLRVAKSINQNIQAEKLEDQLARQIRENRQREYEILDSIEPLGSFMNTPANTPMKSIANISPIQMIQDESKENVVRDDRFPNIPMIENRRNNLFEDFNRENPELAALQKLFGRGPEDAPVDDGIFMIRPTCYNPLSIGYANMPIGLEAGNPNVKTGALTGTVQPMAPKPEETKKDEPQKPDVPQKGQGLFGNVINTFYPSATTTTRTLGLGFGMAGGCNGITNCLCGGADSLQKGLAATYRTYTDKKTKNMLNDVVHSGDTGNTFSKIFKDLTNSYDPKVALLLQNAKLIAEPNMIKEGASIPDLISSISKPLVFTGKTFTPKSFGTGDGGVDGLYNDEIEKITDKIGIKVPVIAADEIDKIVDMVSPNTKEFGFIINTNPSNSDGSGKDGYRPGHWMAVYIDNDEDRPSIEFFDPLADPMDPKMIDGIKKIVDKIDNEKYFLFKENMVKHQSDDTNTCGHHSIHFLENRFGGMSWPEASGFIKCMNQSSDKEKQIMNKVKKYENYL